MDRYIYPAYRATLVALLPNVPDNIQPEVIQVGHHNHGMPEYIFITRNPEGYTVQHWDGVAPNAYPIGDDATQDNADDARDLARAYALAIAG